MKEFFGNSFALLALAITLAVVAWLGALYRFLATGGESCGAFEVMRVALLVSIRAGQAAMILAQAFLLWIAFSYITG